MGNSCLIGLAERKRRQIELSEMMAGVVVMCLAMSHVQLCWTERDLHQQVFTGGPRSTQQMFEKYTAALRDAKRYSPCSGWFCRNRELCRHCGKTAHLHYGSECFCTRSAEGLRQQIEIVMHLKAAEAFLWRVKNTLRGRDADGHALLQLRGGGINHSGWERLGDCNDDDLRLKRTRGGDQGLQEAALWDLQRKAEDGDFSSGLEGEDDGLNIFVEPRVTEPRFSEKSAAPQSELWRGAATTASTRKGAEGFECLDADNFEGPYPESSTTCSQDEEDYNNAPQVKSDGWARRGAPQQGCVVPQSAELFCGSKRQHRHSASSHISNGGTGDLSRREGPGEGVGLGAREWGKVGGLGGGRKVRESKTPRTPNILLASPPLQYSTVTFPFQPEWVSLLLNVRVCISPYVWVFFLPPPPSLSQPLCVCVCVCV